MIKLLGTAAVICLVLFELLTPVVARAQIDGIAHDVADTASLEMNRSRNIDEARNEATARAEKSGAKLEKLEIIDAQGTIRATVVKTAPSFVLKRWKKTADWYTARKTVTSNRRAL